MPEEPEAASIDPQEPGSSSLHRRRSFPTSPVASPEPLPREPSPPSLALLSIAPAPVEPAAGDNAPNPLSTLPLRPSTGTILFAAHTFTPPDYPAASFVPFDEYYGGYPAAYQSFGSPIGGWTMGQAGYGEPGTQEGAEQIASAGTDAVLPSAVGTTSGSPPGSGERRHGSVKFFNGQKGFGFILDDAAAELGGDEVFVHYSAIKAVQAGPQGFRSLAEGELVEYTIAHGAKGWQAQDVTGPDGAPCIGTPSNSQASHTSHSAGGPSTPSGRGGGSAGRGRGRGSSGGVSSPSYPRGGHLQNFNYRGHPAPMYYSPMGSQPSLGQSPYSPVQFASGLPLPMMPYLPSPPPHQQNYFYQPHPQGPYSPAPSLSQPNSPEPLYRPLSFFGAMAPPPLVPGPGGGYYPPPPPPPLGMMGMGMGEMGYDPTQPLQSPRYDALPFQSPPRPYEPSLAAPRFVDAPPQLLPLAPPLVPEEHFSRPRVAEGGFGPLVGGVGDALGYVPTPPPAPVERDVGKLGWAEVESDEEAGG